MTEADIATGRQLLQEDFIKSNPKCVCETCALVVAVAEARLACRWVKELELMLETKEKAEIRACPRSDVRVAPAAPRR